MLPNSSELNSPAPSLSWSEVARLCRRVCVLREQGRHDDAETLHTHTLAPLVETFRTAGDSPLTLDERLTATMATESERVANAAVLAELLAPLLAGRAGTPPAPTATGRTPAAAIASQVIAPPAAPAREPASIADFLDEMLAQDARPAPAPGAPRRRAS